MRLIQNQRFITSAHRLDQLPDTQMEIAFAGRSNAGKSSAINTLCGKTRLAFVSKTPGRTQLINFFQFADDAHLVDLPGYGYAEVPEAIRAHWARTLGKYLQGRSNLIGLVLIMDARRPLRDLDWQMINWFAETGNPIHCLLTKSDKLSNQERIQTLKATKEALRDLPQISVQLFSSLKKQGIQEAEAVFCTWLQNARQPDDEEISAEE